MSVAKFIRHDPPLYTAACCVYPYTVKDVRKYVFETQFDEKVLLHKIEGGLLHLPRALCPVGPDDRRDVGEAVVFPKCPTPRDHQGQMFDEVRSFVSKGLSGVVQAYTGFGKTALGYLAAFTAQRKTLVVTTKEDIFDQWVAGAQSMLGLTMDEIGIIRGDRCEVIGTKFCVALVQSLSKDGKYPAWITKGFGLVILDEVHRMAADQFSAVVDMFPAKIRVGLSATFERRDGKDLLLQAHIGPVRAKTTAEGMVPKVLVYKSQWQCPRTFYADKVTGQRKVKKLPHMPGKTAHIERTLVTNHQRNTLIASAAKVAYDKGRSTVIFSKTHDHLSAIRATLLEQGIPGADIGLYIGAANKTERLLRDKSKNKPIILTTFAMMKEGTSIDWLDTLILAMPLADVVQTVGRIRREYEGKASPVVIDIVDQDSHVFAGYAANRRRWYNSIRATIVEMN